MRNEIIYPFFTFYLGILRRPSYQVAIDWMIAEMDIRDAGGPMSMFVVIPTVILASRVIIPPPPGAS